MPPTNTENVRWFKEEVQAHEGQLKAYLRGAFPSVRDVEDVVQESFLRVWKARLNHPIDSARSFLFQVARHLAIDLIRRNLVVPQESLRDSVAESVLEERPNAVETLARSERVAVVAEALAELPDRCREIFILRKLKQVPQKEIAERLGISERTVESQVTRGMKLCEAYFRKRRGASSLRHD